MTVDSLVWRYVPGIQHVPAFRTLRQKDCEFKVSLGYISNPVSKPQELKI